MKIKTTLAAALLSLASVASHAAVLTFDGLYPVYGYGVPGPNMTLTERSLSYTENGYVLTLWAPNSEPNTVHIGDSFYSDTFNWHDGGENGNGSYVTLRRADGGAFDLSSFEYGDTASGFTARAAGYADQELIGFETSTVPYLGITEIRFFGVDNYSRLDNIVVEAATAAVPEPGSAALLLAGLGLAGLARRRKD